MIKFLTKSKDGGPKSPVDAYFLIEWKSVFSIALLKFNKGAREEFHTHAFNAWTWFIVGDMVEENVDGYLIKYQRNILPKITKKNKNHRVIAYKDSWCITVRGPWDRYWTEYNKTLDKTTILTYGRKMVEKDDA